MARDTFAVHKKEAVENRLTLFVMIETYSHLWAFSCMRRSLASHPFTNFQHQTWRPLPLLMSHQHGNHNEIFYYTIEYIRQGYLGVILASTSSLSDFSVITVVSGFFNSKNLAIDHI